MKKKKVQKKKKKQGEKDVEEIKPTKHEKVGNVNCYSEEIAREIINKLISLTFTSLYMKKMNRIIEEFYVINIMGTINKLVEINHMNHDMDINTPISQNSGNKSFNDELKKKKLDRRIIEKKIYNKNLNNINYTEGNNENELIPQKTCTDEIDINYLRNKGILYSVEVTNKNFWETIPQPQSDSFERTSTYKNFIKIEKEKKIKNAEPPGEKKKSYIKLKTFYNKFLEKKIDEYYKIKKKPQAKINDELPSERISNEILGIKEEEEDIKIMRKQLMEEIDKKNLEKKIEKERQRLEELAKKNEKNKKGKNKGDSNDKGLNPELFIKEFISISSNMKEIKAGSPISIIEEEKKALTKRAKKNIEYNKIQAVQREIEEIKQNKLLQKLFLKKFKLKNVNNKEDSDSEESEEPTGNLKPSGSNFELIKPEIGVIIQENAKVKSGGINFYEKFNKFSVSDFNKTMNTLFERNSSNNINNFDSNTYINNRMIMNNINSNSNNNAMTPFNNMKKRESVSNDIDNQMGDDKNEELKEKYLFRKTFMNKLTNLKKKFMYKSQSEICLSNNCNSDILREALSTRKNEKSYYYYSSNLFDSNKSKNEFNNNFELSYIGKRKNKYINKKFFSPIPTNLINTYKNSLLKKYFNEADKNDTNQNINLYSESNKFKVMDTFNKNIVDWNDKNNDILYQKIIRNTKNNFLPKIKHSESLYVNQGIRTKNYFFRTRKKKKIE